MSEEKEEQVKKNLKSAKFNTKPLFDNSKQGKWTHVEHKKLLEAIKIYGRNWRLVQNAIGTRTRA